MRAYAGLGLTILMMAQPARANPETAFLSDGRSVAMGGVGVAANDYAASVWHNPAGLSSVEKLSVTGTLIPLITRVDRPFPDPTTGQPESVKGETRLGGLGALAVGYRVHERVAVGFGTYIFSGTGVHFDNVVGGQDLSATAFAGELQFPISVNVTRALSLAASYRVTFARVRAEVPLPLEPPGMGFASLDSKLSGWDFAGFAFGVRYRFNEAFRAGFTYRTKVVVDLEGSTETSSRGETVETDTRADYPLPHTFKFGSELRLLDQRLLLAADLNVWLYEESHPRNPALGRAEDWNNAVRVHLGGEYFVRERVAVRAGFYIGNSATSEGAATPLVTAPIPLYGLSAGAGLKLRDTMDLDFSFAYSGSVKRTVSPEDNPLAPGPYGGGFGLYFGSSLSYRM